MDMQTIIADLEKEWDLDLGFLGNLRAGDFAPEKLESLIRTLETALAFTKSDSELDKRLVSLIYPSCYLALKSLSF